MADQVHIFKRMTSQVSYHLQVCKLNHIILYFHPSYQLLPHRLIDSFLECLLAQRPALSILFSGNDCGGSIFIHEDGSLSKEIVL